MSKRNKLLAAFGALVAVGFVGLGAFYYLVLRDNAPAAVSINDAVSALRNNSSSGATNGASGDDRVRDLAGTWNVVQGGNSFVGYRVQEELAGIGASTAVGRTQAITGQLNFDGRTITAVQVQADLTQLKSDRSLRDRQLTNQGIETGKFPSATFTLSSPISINNIPNNGEKVMQTVSGKLTLHGVTRDLQLQVEGALEGTQLVVVGNTTILFADYGIDPPRAASVLSIDDKGVMEFQLVFARA